MPVTEPEHTVASVFANFPDGEDPAPDGEEPVQAADAEKPKRRRFDQQTMHSARKRTAKSGAA